MADRYFPRQEVAEDGVNENSIGNTLSCEGLYGTDANENWMMRLTGMVGTNVTLHAAAKETAS